MLSLRLRQAQTELQWHRAWISSFTAGQTSLIGRQRTNAANPSRCFSHQSQSRSRVNANANADVNADADAGVAIRRQVGRTRKQKHKQKHHVEDDGGGGGGGGGGHGRRLHASPSPAQRRKQERWSGRRQTTTHVHLAALSTRADLLQAIEEGRTKEVMRLYEALPEKRPLAKDDFVSIAQCMHQALRLENQARVRKENTLRKDTDEIVAFADRLVTDVRQGNMLPSPKAHIHLLGIYKESGHLDAGKTFWSWLRGQDDAHTQIETYALAIELEAIAGAQLRDMEALYEEALSRFPASFSAYHLSPEAILPDRERFLPVRRLPIGLLQAIAQARLLRGDSRNAYLALDVGLRLRPSTLDQRFLRLFLTVRPLSEAYSVFAMACQAGYKLPSLALRDLLTQLRIRAKLDSVASHVATLRTMLAAIYMQLGCSGTLTPSVVGVLIVSITELFRLPMAAEPASKKRKKLVDAVLDLVRRTFEVFARYGILPPRLTFNAIIVNVAGHGNSKEAMGIALKDMVAVGMKPNDVTLRSVLSVAGMYKDMEFIEKAWNDIVAARRDSNEWPSDTDFYVLAKACKLVGSDFAQRQFDAWRTFVPDGLHSAIQYAIDKDASDAEPASSEPASSEEFMAALEILNADLDYVEKATRDRPVVQDFSTADLPVELIDTNALMQSRLNIPEEDMRELYDKLSTEPPGKPALDAKAQLEAAFDPRDPFQNTASSAEDATGDFVPENATLLESHEPNQSNRSPTNVTFGELRYRSWKTINYLLQLAEKHDQDYDKIVDEAIAAGTRPPAREIGFTHQEVQCMYGRGLGRYEHDSKMKKREKSGGRAPGREMSKKLALEEILRLRGRFPSSVTG